MKNKKELDNPINTSSVPVGNSPEDLKKIFTEENIERAIYELNNFKPDVPFSYLVATRDAIREKNS